MLPERVPRRPPRQAERRGVIMIMIRLFAAFAHRLHLGHRGHQVLARHVGSGAEIEREGGDQQDHRDGNRSAGRHAADHRIAQQELVAQGADHVQQEQHNRRPCEELVLAFHRLVQRLRQGQVGPVDDAQNIVGTCSLAVETMIQPVSGPRIRIA